MAYRFESEGVADLMKQIKALEDRSEMIAAAALYDGAAVMAKEINVISK